MVRSTFGKARTSRRRSSADDLPTWTRNFETDADTLNSPPELGQYASKQLSGAYVMITNRP
jgi:hypothetical protein